MITNNIKGKGLAGDIIKEFGKQILGYIIGLFVIFVIFCSVLYTTLLHLFLSRSKETSFKQTCITIPRHLLR